ncbi:hypothetical protein FQN54_006720 [Arachnomyces sp. PD_36]|nr:hypothetical protein FQN54_006720 [Arachnomyces sp. PD_36]
MTNPTPPRSVESRQGGKWTDEEDERLLRLRGENKWMTWEQFAKEFFPYRGGDATRIRFGKLPTRPRDQPPSCTASPESQDEWEDAEPEVMPQRSTRKRRSELINSIEEDPTGSPEKRSRLTRMGSRQVARRGGPQRLQRTGLIGRITTGQTIPNSVSSTSGSGPNHASLDISQVAEYQRMQKQFRPEFVAQLWEETREREKANEKFNKLRDENAALKSENLALKTELGEMKEQWEKMETFKRIFKEFSQPGKKQASWVSPNPEAGNGQNEL